MTKEILNEYKERGLLYSQVHPELPLTIYNYTDKVQWEGLWDEVTLSCRGLVMDDEGVIVARPFRKFFNLSEGKTSITKDYKVYNKLDGSLIIIFYYRDQWIIASRGSFTSDQAVWAREMFDGIGIAEKLNIDHTYCAEILHPENRIVVNYGSIQDLVFTACFDTKTGVEQEIPPMILTAGEFDTVPLDKLADTIDPNAEGYVVRFSNGERCKVKGEEYIRLHKLMSDMSTTAVWRVLSNGDKIEDVLVDVPDEFFQDIKNYEEYLKNKFNDLQAYILWRYEDYSKIVDQKEFAIAIVNHPEKHYFFNLRNGKGIEEMLWKEIKPEFKRL